MSVQQQQDHGSDKVALNRHIVLLGQRRDWRELLRLVERESHGLNHVHVATALTQLGRLPVREKVALCQEDLFGQFLEAVTAQLEARGLEWSGPRGAANMLHAVAKLGPQLVQQCNSHDSVVGRWCAWISHPAVAENFLELAQRESNPRSVSNVAWALAKLEECRTTTVAATTKDSASFFDCLERNREMVQWLVQHGNAQTVSNTVWAYAKLGIPAPNLCVALVPHAERLFLQQHDKHVDTAVSVQSIANTAWALATLQCDRDDDDARRQSQLFFERVIDNDAVARRIVGEGRPQNVSNVAWACATLRVAAPRFWRHLDRRADMLWNDSDNCNAENGNGNSMQAVANVIWAAATLRQQVQQPQHVVDTTPRLRRSLETNAARFARQGSSQNIANVAWACAVLDWEVPCFFQELEQQQHGGANRFALKATHHDYSLVLWAFSTMGLHPPPRRLLAALPRLADEIMTQPLSTAHAAWACATLLLPCDGDNGSHVPEYTSGDILSEERYLARLFGQIQQHADALVHSPQCGTQNVANTLWALAALRFDAPDYVAAVNGRAEWLVAEGKPKEVSCLLYACALLRDPAPGLVGAFDEQLLNNNAFLENWDQQNISNALWAYASQGRFGNNSEAGGGAGGESSSPSSSLDILWRRATEMIADEGVVFTAPSLWQLAHTRLYAKGHGVALPPAPDIMLEAMRRATLRFSRANLKSKASYEISDALLEIGFQHEMEVAPDPEMVGGNMLGIDMACVERRIAVECDGPRHYLKKATVDDRDAVYGGRVTLTTKETGRTIAKRRVLQQLGWTVVNLDFRDFMRAQDEDNVHGWLRGSMEAAGVELQ